MMTGAKINAKKINSRHSIQCNFLIIVYGGMVTSYKVLDSLTGLLNITNYIQIDCMNFEGIQT